MYLEFKKNNFNVSVNDLFLRKDNKTLKIFYGDTGDIYFDIFGERKRNANGINFATFTISREDDVYSYFEELFNDILEYHVYYSGDIIDEVDKSLNYELKKKNANSILVSNGTMELYSDSIYDEKANLLRISKVEESILLEFFDNEDDPTFGFGIRISNSSSKYDPFNLCFMRFFNRLQHLEIKTEDFMIVQKKLVLKGRNGE